MKLLRTLPTLAALLLAACSNPATAPTSPQPQPPAPPTPVIAEVRQTIQADAGGTLVHPAGARLVVPTGALSADAALSLKVVGDGPALERLVPASKRFLVGLEGATLKKPVVLELNYQTPTPDTPSFAIATQDEDGTPWLRKAQPGRGTASISLLREFKLRTEGARTFQVIHVPELDLAAPQVIVQTPYYWQDNLPWCVPTSLAIVMNHYEGLGSTVANWQLAGADGQAADEGNSYVEILNSLGVHKQLYDYIKWDADLIPLAPFTNYLKFMVNTSGRATALSSTTTTHAFVGVGASNTHVWLHDPSGAFSGEASIAEKLTWGTFRQVAIDETQTTELRTLIFHKPPKSPPLRRGSIVLEEGVGGSLAYVKGGQVLSTWEWDGSSWKSGYIWDDPSGILPQDPLYGNRFPRTGGTGAVKKLEGHFNYKAKVANVTSQLRNYQLYVFLGNNLGTLDSKLHEISVPAYTWKTSLVTGVLANFNITQDGEYYLRFELLEGGEFQDIKTIRFYVGDGPLAIN
ncbi:MAG: C39 family peptidase [Meiothermus sp.]|nr:C39 family peptidase [Meiothermus sp.]